MRNHCNHALHRHPTKDEDQVYIFCCPMAQRVPGEDRDIIMLFAKRASHAMETGLQQALPRTPRIILQGSQQTITIQHYGPSHAQGHCVGAYWQPTGEREVLLPDNRPCTETPGVHAAANAQSNY